MKRTQHIASNVRVSALVEIKRLEQIVDALGALSLGDDLWQLETRVEMQRFARRQVRQIQTFLPHKARDHFQRVAIVTHAVEPQFSKHVVIIVSLGQHVEERRFPRSTGSDDGQNLTGANDARRGMDDGLGVLALAKAFVGHLGSHVHVGPSQQSHNRACRQDVR